MVYRRKPAPSFFGSVSAPMGRRAFLGFATGAAGLAAVARIPTLSGDRVVIVGGGVAGLATARQIKASAPRSSVVLLDRYPGREAARLVEEGITVHAVDAVDVDWGRRRLHGWNGEVHDFDRLVVAPGVAFRTDAIDGYSGRAMDAMPAFWSGRSDEDRFMAWLTAVRTGGTIVIAAPPRPHRFMTGPYLRANRAAHWLAVNNPRAKVILVDANPSPLLALDGVERVVADVTGVDAGNRRLVTTAGALTGDLVNLIPAQWSGPFAQRAGLTDAAGWCPVDDATCRSLSRDGAWVVGDATALAGNKDAVTSLEQSRIAGSAFS
ncbi:MAG: hypothetical protein ACPGNT_04270 [Rhodospirillales bacterium]